MNSRARRNATLFLLAAGAILWFPVVRLLLGGDPVFLRNLGFRSGPGGTPLAWILAFIVALAYATFAVRKIPLVRAHWRSISLMKLLALVIAVAAAIVEEAFFRRLIMDQTMAAGGGAVIQILASGLVFGLAHGIWGIATGRVSIAVGTMIATGTLGLGLGVVYLVGGRSLAPPIISHFLVTAVIQPGIVLAAFTGQMRRPGPAASE